MNPPPLGHAGDLAASDVVPRTGVGDVRQEPAGHLTPDGARIAVLDSHDEHRPWPADGIQPPAHHDDDDHNQ